QEHLAWRKRGHLRDVVRRQRVSTRHAHFTKTKRLAFSNMDGTNCDRTLQHDLVQQERGVQVSFATVKRREHVAHTVGIQPDRTSELTITDRLTQLFG